MTEPRTLFALAGAPTHPGPLDRSTLLLIDHQAEYTTGALPLDGVADAVAEIGRLLDLARRHGVPVVHVAHRGRAGGLFDPEGQGGAFIDGVGPADGEPVVAKTLPNAFAGTDLHERLRATGRPELIVAGFMTHNCVSSTVRAALDLGYRSTLVAAGTATRDLPDPLGGVRPAGEVQRAELAGLADRCAIVVRDHTAWD